MSNQAIRLEAVRLPRELVLASAGTGKTFRISSRIIGLLASGVAPEAIFASTFTRAAAGEILDRVLQRLARAALDDTEAAELSHHASLHADDPLRFSRGQWLRLLARVARELHRVNIGTLDAFFVRTATTFADDVGLPPGWVIADSTMGERVLTDALHSVLRTSDRGELIELLRQLHGSEARRSVHAELMRRAEEFIAVHRALDPDVAEPWGSFDALARQAPVGLSARIRSLASRFRTAQLPDGIGRRATWEKALQDIAAGIDSGSWSEVVCTTLFRNSQQDGTYYRTPIPDEILTLIEEGFELARYDVARKLSVQSRAMGRLAADLADATERARRELGVYQFDDITRVVGGPAPLALRPDLHYRLDARVQHILLDEFQDTSLAQWEALEPLVDELFSGYADERSAVVVADPKQSIYAWRGGEPLLVAHLNDRYDLTRDSLATSWRSSQVVLDTVNQVFDGIEENPVFGEQPVGRAVAQDWGKAFERHRAAKQIPGYVQLYVGPEDEGQGEDRPQLCRRAAEMVAELRTTAPGMSIGILTRRNATVARLMLELRALGIEASEEGGNPLTDSAAVTAVLALLRLADHPGDRVARYHVAGTPVGAALGLTDFEDAAAARRLAVRTRRRLLEHGYGRTLSEIAAELEGACGPRDRRRLGQLAELGFRYDPQATLRATDFIPVVEAERVRDSVSADVRVMTIHSSKGLEFDIVVLPELDAPLTRTPTGTLTYRPGRAGRVTHAFPYIKREVRELFDDIPELQLAAEQAAEAGWRDGLSGLYVALTRARHALYMVMKPDSIDNRGKVRPSRACTGARLVRAVLAPGKEARPGDILFEDGNRLWYEAAAREEGAAAPAVGERDGSIRAGASVGARRVISLKPSDKERIVGQVAPSALAGASRVDLRWLLSLDTRRAERGTLVHAWFQRIGWLEDGVPTDEELRVVAADTTSGFSPSEVEELSAQLRGWLENPTIRQLLSRESYGPEAAVEREVPFLHRAEGRLVEGIIDRVVLQRENGHVTGAEILDYKTDALDAGNAEEITARAEHYRPQMEAYRQAVASWYTLPLEKVRARLIFLEAGVVVG